MDITVVIAAISEWAWIGWLVLIALFLVIEMLTLDFTFLMLSLGGVAGLLSGLVGSPVWLQIIIAGIAATLLILLLRPPLLRRLHRGEDPARSNIDAIIGLPGFVLHDISATTGQVKLSNGDIWTARTSHPTPIAAGSRIVVEAIEGATVIVRPVQD